MMKNSKFPSIQYISFSMKHAAGYTGMLIFLRLVQALMPSVQILTLAGLLDRAQEAFAAGKFTDALYLSIFYLWALFCWTRCSILSAVLLERSMR